MNQKYDVKKPYKAAAIQLTTTDDLKNNLIKTEQWIARAAEAGATLIVLPECFAFMGSNTAKKELARGELDYKGEICAKVGTWAKYFSVYVIAGTLPIYHTGIRDERPSACSLLFDPQGEIITYYNKVHLFDAEVEDAARSYRESDAYCPGKSIICQSTPLGNLGFSICYDLRFPEFFRILFQQQADIVVVPSAFTEVTGRAHWLTLLRARAIENQFYVIGAAQTGWNTAHRETHGHSAIISPWGDVLDSMEKQEGFVLAEIDLAAQEALRKKMPIKAHQVFKVPML